MGDLFTRLGSYDNLHAAFLKARKGKTKKQYILDFEEGLERNLIALRHELLFHIYKPHPLEIFILRDPKTRKIGKSAFRDRVIHHALCNVIEPLLEKRFIYDSFANRKGKGTLKALERFDEFKRKVSRNNTRTCYVLKADIRHYFDTVDHQTLLSILGKNVLDKKVMWLIKVILANHKTKEAGKGMPLGNLTSQFFANVYLNELDQFVKHQMKAEYYLRYVDDFVILHPSKEVLEGYRRTIQEFLVERLQLQLHPNKSRVINLENGIPFLGFRVFYHHKLVRPMNRRKFERKLEEFRASTEQDVIGSEKIIDSFDGWFAYANHGNVYKYKNRVLQTLDRIAPPRWSVKPP